MTTRMVGRPRGEAVTKGGAEGFLGMATLSIFAGRWFHQRTESVSCGRKATPPQPPTPGRCTGTKGEKLGQTQAPAWRGPGSVMVSFPHQCHAASTNHRCSTAGPGRAQLTDPTSPHLSLCLGLPPVWARSTPAAPSPALPLPSGAARPSLRAPTISPWLGCRAPREKPASRPQ